MPVNSQDIQNWFAANPGASADTIASTAAKYGVNASQIDSALGGHAAQDWVAAQDPSKLVSQYGTDFGYSSAPQTTAQFSSVPSYATSGNDYASTPGPMMPPSPGPQSGQRMSAAQVAGYDNGRNPDYWLTNQGMSNLTGLSMDARSAAGVSSLPDWWLKQNTDANKLATASDPAAYLRQLANQYYSTPESSAMAACSPENEAQWQDMLAKSRSIKDPNSGMYLTRMPNGNYALLNEYGTGRGVYSTSAGADWSNTGVDQALFQQLAAGSGSAHQFKQVPQELIERYRETGNAFAGGPRSPDDVGRYRSPSQSSVDESLRQSLGTGDASVLNMARSMLGIQSGSPAGAQFQPVPTPPNPVGVFGGAGNAQPYSQNQWVNQYLPTINSWMQSHPSASWQDIYRYADSMGVPGLSARLAQLANSPTPDRRSGSAPYLHYGFGPEQLQYDNVNPLTQLVGSQKYAGGGAVAGNTPSATGALNLVRGGSGGQADDQLAWLSPGEYVMDADFVSALGDGNNAAGARQLDRMRENVRAHKRSAPANKIPPKAKTPERYLKGK